MHGLYLLWWVQEKHVAAGAVAFILAAGDLALTALEVPTGWLADRWGHRVSLILGSLLQVAGMVICWLGAGIPALLTASIGVAAGDAFRSGADQALVYRSCVALEAEADFQSIEARSRAIQLVALVAMTLGGGVLVQLWGFTAGWIAEIVACAAGLAVACAMVEPPASPIAGHARFQPDNLGFESHSRPGAGTGSDSIRARTDRNARIGRLLLLTLPASALIAAASAASFWVQTDVGTTSVQSTLFVAGCTLVEAAGAWLAIRARAGVHGQVGLVLAGGAILAAGVTLPGVLIPSVVVLSLVIGAVEPLRAVAIQRETKDGWRARAASVVSACDKALTTAAFVWAGLLPRRRRVP